jgi:hypothetical protein
MCCCIWMHAGSGGKSPAQQLSVHTLKLQQFFLNSSTSNQPYMRFTHQRC